MRLFSILVVFWFCLALPWVGSAAEKQSARIGDCMECHGRADITGEKMGETVSMRVDETLLRGSVHGELSCVECHAQAVGSEGGEGPPHPGELPRVTCNRACHREGGPAGYEDSIHGRLARKLGDPDVALCQDCHGGHDVVKCTDPASDKPMCNPCQGCARCHENEELVIKHHIHKKHPCLQWQLSVHGAPRMVDGELKVPARCTDCHGVHAIKGVGTPHLPARRPETCGKCHPEELKKYLESIHGVEAVRFNNPDAPLCTDCHGEHNILSPEAEKSRVSPKHVPETCAGCHARPSLMKKYGIEPDKVETFINSFHGIALGFNEEAVATCASCHGHHLVLPASDPRSTVYPGNLPDTCGKPSCHPNMPRSIRNAKIHVDYSSPESGAVYWVRTALVWALIILIVVSVVWVIPDIVHRIRVRMIRKKGK